ncbi:MAG TPA: amidohydrolase family protein [Pyrinomonadaceae bacterium]|jgi:beta-aspartyl-dipeptidase (metallo-type)
MFTLIENGEIYAPASSGVNSVLLTENKILKIGELNRSNIDALGIEYEVINAAGCVITPGFIDPHEHLLGGSGEKGFSSQTPEISATEIIEAGITTVVGCLGVDTTMKTMAGLLAKAKALKEEGLSAYIWSGGYDVPPTTITDSVRNDIMFIEEVIGAGEIAISDERSTDHVPHELARLVIDTHNGGMLSRKAGVTHFHVGESKERLKSIRNILDEFPIEPDWIYPTHIIRSEELMKEAIELAGKGAFVDIDTVDEDLPRWLRFYLDNGGKPEQLTISTDASITSPKNLIEQIRICILEHKFKLEEVLPLVTSNTARVLKFENKGEIAENKSADLLVLEKDTLEIREVICGGRRLFKDGSLAFKERFLKESNRIVNLRGEKQTKTASGSDKEND